MSTEQRLLLTDILKPKHPIRPIRRNSPEYMEMVESIRKDGVLQPILVRPVPGGWEVVEGWHRFETSKEAGKLDIPVLIRDLSDEEVLVIQLKCQAIRPPTASFEYARRLKLLMQSGITMPQLSRMIDKTPNWIRDQLHLNRVCDAARGPIERGEIAMSSALALANLSMDLQDKFIDDAIAMKASDFVVRAEAALRDYKAYLLNEKQEDKEIGASRPTLRTINTLKREALKPRNAKAVLKATKAKTPLDGWEACLSWVFKLDPVTVSKRKEKREEEQNTMNTAEYRRTNRELIDKFVKNQSSIGDYRNG